MDNLTPEEAVRRGLRAAEILSDPVFQDATEETRKALVSQWIGTEDRDEQHNLWAAVRSIETIHKTLRRYVAAGQVAKSRREV